MFISEFLIEFLPFWSSGNDRFENKSIFKIVLILEKVFMSEGESKLKYWFERIFKFMP